MKPEEAVKHLANLYREQHLAHAYLFETNNIEKCYEDIMILVKQIVCPNEYSDGCKTCNLCHLIEENSLPSLIVVKPDGSSIKKDSIETIKENFANKSLYTNECIYIIEYPEKMNAVAFNKLLKFLEEPENNILAFLITENKNKVASTIVSRCELIKMVYPNAINIDSDYYKLSKEYLLNIKSSITKALLFNYEILLEKFPDRDSIITFFQNLLLILKEKGDFEKTNIVVKYLKELEFNVNSMLLLDSFVVEMGNSYGK